METISIQEYLTRKGIVFRESGKELITHCLFNGCDDDSRGSEAHLYFDAETGQYDCKKCGEKGNLITLAKHFGDGISEIALNPSTPTQNPRKSTKFDAELVETCHLALPTHIRQHLNTRGITDPVIDAHKLGWGKFYNKWWITIPIQDIYGAFRFFKLRQDPSVGNEKRTYPKGTEDNPVHAQIYGWDTLANSAEKIVICEGELDRLALLSKNIPAITSTHGAMTFKQEWCEKVVKGSSKIYICFDNDDAGKKGAEKVAKMVENGGNETYIITLPQEVGEGGDITDYLVKLNGNPDDLFSKYAKEYPEKIDTSQFKPFSSQDLVEILGLTIKQDEENKLITFFCQLSAYTEDSQFNISFNAPSSSGKSYIPIEISRFFPDEDLIKLGTCSPRAFYHEQGAYKKETNTITVDLARKIIIFFDQPNSILLKELRSLLSHDEKEIQSKITDKNQRGGNITKTVIIKGFPSVIFCSAWLNVDEQESTRFLLLSPETTKEKLLEAIHEKIVKDSDKRAYQEWLNQNPERRCLQERILAIKREGISDVKIICPERIERMFLERSKMPKPRHSRDVGRIISFIKSFALLNLWFRERDDTIVVANDTDIDEAFRIWDAVSVSQELNLPPYIYDLYQEVILKAWQDKNANRNEDFAEATGVLGLSRQEILKKYYEVYGRMLNTNQLRQQILPMLETAGLIVQEANDPSDKRKMLIYPTALSTKSPDQKNSESEGGVKNSEENNSETSSGVTSDLEVF